MNRGDMRLIVIVVSTATLASVGTAFVLQLLQTKPNDEWSLEHRVHALETLCAPPAPPTVPAPPPRAPELVPVDDPVPCDEVACVLDNYEPVCCAAFRKGYRPESLDRAAISVGVAKIRSQVAACGERSSAKGRVKVSVKVAADGTVSNVALRESPDPALGACVVTAMQHAHFQSTELGGAFGYPFIF